MADTGTYVYAISRGLDPGRLRGLSGVTGAPVRAVEHVGLAALVSTVDLTEFGEEPLRRNLEDLGWLEATARAHHRVVDAAAGSTPVAPLRLATVYRGDERVRELLGERREAFAAALSRVAGRTEWGVKAYADPGAFTGETAEDAGRPGTATGGARPGTAYLLRRRSQWRSREEGQRGAAARAEEIDAALRGVAVASRRHRPQDPRLSGHEGWMVLNGAYLVDDARTEDLRSAVARLGDENPGVRLELTGPWAPYSFATIDEEEEGTRA